MTAQTFSSLADSRSKILTINGSKEKRDVFSFIVHQPLSCNTEILKEIVNLTRIERSKITNSLLKFEYQSDPD